MTSTRLSAFRKRAILIFAAALLLVGGAEVAARLSGIADIPLYRADAVLGYVPAPAQRGAFLNRNEWVFNALSMGAEEFAPDPQCNILLVGDSIVLGGNPYRQSDKLGPQLQTRAGGCRIWPIAAGSWALLNELAYVEQHFDDVARLMRRIVIVSNSEDFGDPSVWRSERTHPTRRPISALLSALEHFVLPHAGDAPAAITDRTDEWSRRLSALAARFGRPITIVIYPDRAEIADPALRAARFAAPRQAFRQAGVGQIVEVAADPRWSGALYRDSIHPTVAGMAILAEIIADAIAGTAPIQVSSTPAKR